MSLGLHERRVRRRRRFWWNLTKWLFAVAIFVAIGAYAYYAGSDLARRDVKVQEERAAELEVVLAAEQEKTKELEAKLRIVLEQAAEWKTKYERDIPSGQMKELLRRVDGKLSEGISPDRLAFVIDQAAEPRDCEELAATKRFIVRTPIWSGANDAVSFDGNKVTVTALGENAVNNSGAKESWFDVDKPLTVSFTEIGGTTTKAEGLLPIHHAVVTGDSEYRFTVIPGAKGFVTVTGQRCAYP